ncbi:unnamed protein product [Pseudo-nitzschia multistriata]|uniref:Uncharacterized protein n=1 Tax=Pseudo-nitzschia multistriata TaxID=183589 RepID=A0A448YW08_9STRA|nr:unnamed protein product [Pseudo-nitzschia multistriata]
MRTKASATALALGICHAIIPVESARPLVFGLSAFAPTPARKQHGRTHGRSHRSLDWAGSKSRLGAAPSEKETGLPNIEGLLPERELERLVAVDETVRALKKQLPTILTRPLTPAVAEDAFCKEGFCLSVLVDVDVDDESESQKAYKGSLGGTGAGAGAYDEQRRKPPSERIAERIPDEIVLLNGRDELVALGDVLVLATALARQAVLVTGTMETGVGIECQLILDEACETVRIPWRAKTPVPGSLPVSAAADKRFNYLEGITDCYLRTSSDSETDGQNNSGTGRVHRMVVRKATFNGRTLNGPAIGQALKGIQSTVANLQQNPILQNIVGAAQQQQQQQQEQRQRQQQPRDGSGTSRGPSLFNTLRDEFLGQAATAVSARLSPPPKESAAATGGEGTPSSSEGSAVPVFRVASIADLPLDVDRAWLDEDSIRTKAEPLETATPCPGTEEWKDFVDASFSLRRFCSEVIPQLSDLNIVDSNLFAGDASYKNAADGTVLLAGRESLAGFFQSIALTRKGTGISWETRGCEVLDWKNRTVAVRYEMATKGFPLWTVSGRDVYVLDATLSSGERPVVLEILQGPLVARGPNQNEIPLDGLWLVDNLSSALGVDGASPGTTLPRDFLTELLRNQLPGPGPPKPPTKRRRRLSEHAAASVYYIMADLHEQGLSLFDTESTTGPSPPAIEYMAENLALRGYLGEPILRGSALYDRSVRSVLFALRESVKRGRLRVEGPPVPPRVELRENPEGCVFVRLTLTVAFRIPPPGPGILQQAADSLGPASGLPLRVELVSDYGIDPERGKITEHRLVETRINGQLTAGDQVSLWMKRFLNAEGNIAAGGSEPSRAEERALGAIADALSWFRSG